LTLSEGRTVLKFRYLVFSLFHPAVLKGGAQAVAKDLFDEAREDEACSESLLLAAIDAQNFPKFDRVGASITGLAGYESEFLLLNRTFDFFYNLVNDPRCNKAIRKLLLDFRPDVIHIHHSLFIGLDIIQLIRSVCPDAAIVYTLHEYIPICFSCGQLFRYHEGRECKDFSPSECTRCFPHLSIDQFVARKMTFLSTFSQVDHFISPSVCLRDRFIQWGIPAGKISVIPNGHQSRRPSDFVPSHSPEVNKFGYFGQFLNAKGIDVLVSAVSDAGKRVNKRLELDIYGGNKSYATHEFREKVEGIIKEMPSNVTVRVHGEYTRDCIFDLMASVDWIVIPSVWPESFCLVLSEARDARRPVLVSDIGGPGERTTHMHDGICFPAGSVSGLADWITKCAGNESLWHEIASGVTDDTSLQDTWAQYRELFLAEVSRRQQRAR